MAAATESQARRPSVDFAHFLVTIGNTALVHLGEINEPGSKPSVNLPLARHSVDVLRVLKKKTQGNLDEEESKLLEALLSELGPKLEAAEAP